MAYQNSKGEFMYIFGWLQADPGSDDFKPTTGGNSVWAKTKTQAISRVRKRQEAHEKEYPNSVRLRVDPNTCRRAKSYREFAAFDYGLYLTTV